MKTALYIVFLYSNRWLKIQVTARQNKRISAVSPLKMKPADHWMVSNRCLLAIYSYITHISLSLVLSLETSLSLYEPIVWWARHGILQ